ncbi:3-keto-disaccharide hydrolase [Flavihumibacter profundi]|uniref:3-keto-disaccharide hydrolase n=1 Tax=Flavihumibacter profundi TaxID=2716883 RepID=UPI001CC342B5|nr:DUF1080 domain-containing protein [Flavihumibacter profundi]MBZ5856688.1 DUF1080 domain-containing protein [Flavihumibacter profundi]
MKRYPIFLLLLVIIASPALAQDNKLTKRQKADGWILLFDGKTTKGWKGAFLNSFPEKGWQVADGQFIVEPSEGKESVNGGDIVTNDLYSDFELMVDFKLTEGANSGIKYFVDPAQPVPANPRSALGLEFQVLDDDNHPDAKLGIAGNRTLGSLYDLIAAPANKPVHPVGQWNTARIISKGSHVEHWLNGVKLFSYERGSDTFRQLVANSKYKDFTGFGLVKEGRILLQDHGNRVYFKNIYLRKL